MKLDDLHEGADVVSRDGHRVGKLSRVVVNEKSLALTHLVVDPGLLHSGESLWQGGWGNPHERVIPLGVLESEGSEEIHITMTAAEFAHMSIKYDDVRFKLMADLEPGKLDRSDVEAYVESLPGGIGPTAAYDVFAKDPDEVDIAEGSAVWRMKPHEKIGEVDHVLFDEETKKVTALVIRRGFVFHHEVVLPVRFIVEVIEILEGVVRVEMTDSDLDGLDAYSPVG